MRVIDTLMEIKVSIINLKLISERCERLNRHSSANAASFKSSFQTSSNFRSYHRLSIYLG